MAATNNPSPKLCVITISFPVTHDDVVVALSKEIDTATLNITPVRVDVRTVSQRGQIDGGS